MVPSRIGFLLVAIFVFVTAKRAMAQPDACDASHPRWVAVSFDGEAWSQELRVGIVAQLASGFAVHGIGACAAGQRTTAPIATVVLRAPSGDLVHVAVEVDDSVTQKRVGRDVPVGQFDEEGKVLAITVATEELVRASWAEVLLTPPREQPRPEPPAPPPEVQQVVRSSVRPEVVGPRRTRLGIEGAFERYGVGQAYYGGDLVFRQWMGRWLGLELRAGGRRGVPVTLPSGRIDGTLVSGGLGLPLRLLDTRRVDLSLSPEVRLLQVGLAGDSRQEDVEGRDGSGAAIVTRLGLLTTFSLGDHAELAMRVGAGGVVLGAEARASGSVEAGVAGSEMGLALGVMGAF